MNEWLPIPPILTEKKSFKIKNIREYLRQPIGWHIHAKQIRGEIKSEIHINKNDLIVQFDQNTIFNLPLITSFILTATCGNEQISTIIEAIIR